MKKFKKALSIISATVMSGLCMLNNLSAVNVSADDTNNYGLGCLEVPQSQENEFYNQFPNTDSSVNFDNIGTLPNSCDLSTNSDSKYFPSIGHQGSIGSCVSWATTYYQYTYAANKLNNITTTAENAYSPSWTYNLTNNGLDEGSYYTDAYNVLKNQGALKMSEMPYNKYNYSYEWSNNTEAMINALKTRVSYVDKVSIPSEGTPITNNKDIDLNQAKHLLNTGHVLTVEASSNSGFTNWSYKPRYNRTDEKVAYRAVDGGNYHLITIVGYNDSVRCDVNGNGVYEDSECGAFKIANSWGTGWGNNGYMWVLYDALNETSCNTTNNWETSLTGTRVAAFSKFNYIEVNNYDVNLIGELTLNTNYRNKLTIDLFRNTNSSTAYTNSIKYLNAELKINYPSQLEQLAPFNGKLIFDYSNYAYPTSICKNGYYFGIDVNNIASTSSSTSNINSMSYRIMDDKCNTVKSFDSFPTSVNNGRNVTRSMKVQNITGDLNYDNVIDVNDKNILIDYLISDLALSHLQYYLGDINGDGRVNSADVTAINKYISK